MFYVNGPKDPQGMGVKEENDGQDEGVSNKRLRKKAKHGSQG